MSQLIQKESYGTLSALKGLCHGIGQSEGPCGLLTGGACALAFALTTETGRTHPLLTPLVHDYASWFLAKVAPLGGERCTAITAGLGSPRGTNDPMLCADLLGASWEEMCRLLSVYEITLPYEE